MDYWEILMHNTTCHLYCICRGPGISCWISDYFSKSFVVFWFTKLAVMILLYLPCLEYYIKWEHVRIRIEYSYEWTRQGPNGSTRPGLGGSLLVLWLHSIYVAIPIVKRPSSHLTKLPCYSTRFSNFDLLSLQVKQHLLSIGSRNP